MFDLINFWLLFGVLLVGVWWPLIHVFIYAVLGIVLGKVPSKGKVMDWWGHEDYRSCEFQLFGSRITIGLGILITWVVAALILSLMIVVSTYAGGPNGGAPTYSLLQTHIIITQNLLPYVAWVVPLLVVVMGIRNGIPYLIKGAGVYKEITKHMDDKSIHK